MTTTLEQPGTVDEARDSRISEDKGCSSAPICSGSRSKFQIIYADPPWQYAGSLQKNSAASDHYKTMTTWEISRLPIEKLADENCTLLMWGTWPKLADALYLMQAWGFEYKTVGFVWVKANPSEQVGQLTMIPQAAINDFMGLGLWTRSNTEYCLIGTRGKPQRKNADVRQVVYEPLGRHSEKPQEVRDRIVQLLGDVPRIELFARRRAPGWSVFGNEVESDVALVTPNTKVRDGDLDPQPETAG